ncbi:MAG: ribosome-associated translation inhibitor RaiA [Bacteroidetes bacterium]|nr:ribosome-associated translation inhibitor RaiA [Rhodothermia bacterium]MCS7155250.1 ribosome-associated translation inhibitor RaiA [Bacteroidota bacterium]MCX7907835.1 ribosome-associated translation inhibitor RaiA [Bacteroidota bacterium]MDW8138654.1 ribosome-associated translation inhibitor RaiA [Bacteroidota bacterium]MDW8284760.1 ribosome-associated translation inhibitor RaiA [Bacteroidota bacterium]
MKVYFTARHFKARPELQRYAEQAVTRLERLYNGIVDCNVVLEDEGAAHRKRSEIWITVYDQILKATSRAPDFELAIDEAVEKLRRQLVRYKERRRRRIGPDRRDLEAGLADSEAGETLG